MKNCGEPMLTGRYKSDLWTLSGQRSPQRKRYSCSRGGAADKPRLS